MRIVFLSYNYSPDIQSPQDWLERIKFYVGWCECLTKEHTVIRVDQINYEGSFTHNNVRYYCVDEGKKGNHFPGKLNLFVKGLRPDVVVVSSFQFPLQVILLRQVLGKKVRIIIQHHAEKPFTGVKKFIQWISSRMADAFLFTSYETGAEWVRKKNLHTLNKIHEIMEVSSIFYPIDKSIARNRTQISGSPVYLWVGRLNQNKDPLTAINAFFKFCDWQPEAKLFMIYHTAELATEIENLILSNPGKNPIVMVGQISHDELLYWFNSADFFISASHYEGSGTALCEAMSCGCIPLVTDIPPFRMICGNSALYYEPGNVDALLLKLLETVHLRVDEKKNLVLNRFKTELTFEVISTKFQQILDSL
ncbi:MAG: glycosyltransferase family 4 protein [Bacteroidota bacterium]|nr:glycosyltransferase family 4 protein [Bacteroidota bacterium]